MEKLSKLALGERAKAAGIGGIVGIFLTVATLLSMPDQAASPSKVIRIESRVAADASQWGKVVTLIEVPFQVDPSVSRHLIYSFLPRSGFEVKSFLRGSRYVLDIDIGGPAISVLAIYHLDGRVVVPPEQAQVWREMRRSTLSYTAAFVGTISTLLVGFFLRNCLKIRRRARKDG